MRQWGAGRPPFLGDDALAVISQQINTAPVAPSWHNPEVPKPLEALTLRLLAKSPDERPASAQHVATELRHIRDRTTVDVEPELAGDAGGDLRGLDWGRFVGRREELDQLKEALEEMLSGRGSLAMVVGEPGIGKTRLAEEFGVYAALRGTQVLTGRCYEGESSIPFRPLVEAFRPYVQSRPDQEVRSQMGAGAPEIATLLSEIRQRFPEIAPAPPLEAEAERLRLFESVTQFVRNAAAASPLVLQIDDLHWADKPSLLLLQYLTRSIGSDRVLILGAYRDVELDRTHPLAEALATLRRTPRYRRVLLRGLPEDDVLAMISTVEGAEATSPARRPAPKQHRPTTRPRSKPLPRARTAAARRTPGRAPSEATASAPRPARRPAPPAAAAASSAPPAPQTVATDTALPSDHQPPTSDHGAARPSDQRPATSDEESARVSSRPPSPRTSSRSSWAPPSRNPRRPSARRRKSSRSAKPNSTTSPPGCWSSSRPRSSTS